MKRTELPRISLVTDLVNMHGEAHAHPCFKMEFTNNRITHSDGSPAHFPAEEILRMEGLAKADVDDPAAQTLLKYPIEEYRTFVHLSFGAEDVVPANHLDGDPVFESLHPNLQSDILSGRMDVVLLGMDSKIVAARPCSHILNFWNLRETYEDGRFGDKFLWPDNKHSPVFMANTGVRSTEGDTRVTHSEGMVVGRWPNRKYQPSPEALHFLETGNPNPHAIGRGGRGVAIFFRNGMYDLLINTFRHMLGDRDEERTVELNGEKVTATVRVESPHRSWLRYCHLTYADARSLASETEPETAPEAETADGEIEPEEPAEAAPDSDGTNGVDESETEEPAAEGEPAAVN